VVFVDEDFSEFEAAGKELCHHPLFENQTNVNFVTVKDRNHLKVTTYERGCGLTLACGTGICASAFAAYRNDLANQNVQVQAALGTLNIEIDDQETVFMSGPAKRICKGEYDYD
jgi:diaminopimelate epimerase